MIVTLDREPPIMVTKGDFDKLSRLAAAGTHLPVAQYLQHELDRAHIVDEPADADTAVRLGSKVRFLDRAKSSPSDVILVMPHEADIAKGSISVMTPVGAALLGLTKGQEITFTLPNGEDRTLAVLEVGCP